MTQQVSQLRARSDSSLGRAEPTADHYRTPGSDRHVAASTSDRRRSLLRPALNLRVRSGPAATPRPFCRGGEQGFPTKPCWVSGPAAQHPPAALELYLSRISVCLATPYCARNLLSRSLPPSCMRRSWSGFHASMVTELRAGGDQRDGRWSSKRCQAHCAPGRPGCPACALCCKEYVQCGPDHSQCRELQTTLECSGLQTTCTHASRHPAGGPAPNMQQP